jgi:hypothetical protein
VTGGHAIINSKYNFNVYNLFTLPNTWGTGWCRLGVCDINWDKYKPKEAWLITKRSVILKFNIDVFFGMSGDKIINLQNALKIKGFFNYNVTGYFGPITLLAVRAFQKANGIITTGYVGPLTRACLNKIFNL